MKRVLSLLCAIVLVSGGFWGCACLSSQDRVTITRGTHSIQLVDSRYGKSVNDCHKEIPRTWDGTEYKKVYWVVKEDFDNGGCQGALEALCSKHNQRVVVFSMCYSNSGFVVAASLVFPGRDEMDSSVIPDVFLREAFSILRKHPVNPWTEYTPYIIHRVVIQLD